MTLRALWLGLGILLFSAGVLAGDPSVLRLEITGLEAVEGNIIISVYDNEDDWLGENAVLTKTVVIADSRVDGVVITELALPWGNYAVSLFYDVNGNAELDTNFIGIPREPLAISNNVRPRFGPPKYRDAEFALDAAVTVQRIAITSI